MNGTFLFASLTNPIICLCNCTFNLGKSCLVWDTKQSADGYCQARGFAKSGNRLSWSTLEKFTGATRPDLHVANFSTGDLCKEKKGEKCEAISAVECVHQGERACKMDKHGNIGFGNANGSSKNFGHFNTGYQNIGSYNNGHRNVGNNNDGYGNWGCALSGHTNIGCRGRGIGNSDGTCPPSVEAALKCNSEVLMQSQALAKPPRVKSYTVVKRRKNGRIDILVAIQLPKATPKGVKVKVTAEPKPFFSAAKTITKIVRFSSRFSLNAKLTELLGDVDYELTASFVNVPSAPSEERPVTVNENTPAPTPPSTNGGGGRNPPTKPKCTSQSKCITSLSTCSTASGFIDKLGCTKCNSGHYLDGDICTACTTCAADKYSTTSCSSGVDTSDVVSCQACSDQTHCASSFSTASCSTASGFTDKLGCTKCNSGHYLDGDICTACTTCAADKYSTTSCSSGVDTSDVVSCQACSDQTHCASSFSTASCSTASGFTDKLGCTKCNSGHYLDGDICTACTTCAADKYSTTSCSSGVDTSDVVSCQACSDQTECVSTYSTSSCSTTKSGQLGCTRCKAGSYLDGDECKSCSCSSLYPVYSNNCPENSTTNSPATCTTCACSPGYYITANTCDGAGTTNDVSCSACTVCPWHQHNTGTACSRLWSNKHCYMCKLLCW